jgi:hypothetical protein
LFILNATADIYCGETGIVAAAAWCENGETKSPLAAAFF